MKAKTVSTVALLLAATSALAQSDDLSVYAGLYPHDEVDDFTFIEHPLVVDAVRDAVQSTDLHKTVLKETIASATVIPIREIDGKLLMWAFDPPSGGNYNWGLLISPDGNAVWVCEGTWEDGGFVTEWFTPYTAPQRVAGHQCPAAEEDMVHFESILSD